MRHFEDFHPGDVIDLGTVTLTEEEVVMRLVAPNHFGRREYGALSGKRALHRPE